jgi:hypothetical protein
MSSDPPKKLEGEHDPKLDPQAPLWQWIGKVQPKQESVMSNPPQPSGFEPRHWSDRASEWKRDAAPSFTERLTRANAARRSGEAVPRVTPDYLILEALRVICLIGACIAPFVGLFAAMETASGYHFLIGLLSGVSLLLAAAWIGLAIDVAKHAKQAAEELKELRLLLTKQLEPPVQPVGAKA